MTEASGAMPTDSPAVLVVDDDVAVRRLLRITLEREGFLVDEVDNGEQALAHLDDRSPDAVLLDLQLPGLPGVSVLQQLRERSDVPVIVVAGSSSEDDRVLSLDSGADDYVTKPFSPRELVARVRAHIRRERGAVCRVITRGALRIDVAARSVTIAGRELDLTPKEFDLLVALARRAGAVRTREELLAEVWGSRPEWQSAATVTEHVRRLRAKLGDDTESPQWILAVRGVGYRFAAEAPEAVDLAS